MKRGQITITLLVICVLWVPGAIYAQGAGLQPGDGIGEMVLKTGGAKIVPLWAFCMPAFLNPGLTTTECSVPPVPELLIGHGWFSADEDLRDSSWEAMAWELYLDGQQLGLDAFGTFDADLPQTGLRGYDPDEEVITKLRSWDVVLVNPAAGAHTLRSVLHLSEPVYDGFHITDAGTYELVANFTVEAPPPAATLPETGGITPAVPLWLGVCGLLILTLCLGLPGVIRRFR